MRIFDNTVKNFHMPFIFYAYDRTYLLFCACKKGGMKTTVEDRTLAKIPFVFNNYQIYYCEFDIETGEKGEVYKLNTGMSERRVVCNPSAYHENGEIVITFTASLILPKGLMAYKFYEVRGQTLGNVSGLKVLDPLGLRPFTATQNRRERIVANTFKGNSFIVTKESRRTHKTRDLLKIIFPNVGYIKRIMFSSEVCSKDLLITCPERTKAKNGYGDYQTLYWQRENNIWYRIEKNSKSFYKCSVFGEKIVYAKYTGNKEDYEMSLFLDDIKFKKINCKIEAEKY